MSNTRTSWRTAGRRLVLAGCALGLLWACGQKEGVSHASDANVLSLPVSVMRLVAADLPVTFEYAGQAAGSREVDIRARVGGILLKRNYTEGHQVRKGELLFEIDPEPFQVALQQAKGEMAVREANYGRAHREYERILPLVKENAVSQRDRDNALADYESAKAAVAVARAQLRQAEINLAYTRVTAPIQGLASKARVSEGSLISTAGDTGWLTKVSQTDPIYVNFSLSDNELLKLRQDVAGGQLRIPDNDHYPVQIKLGDGSFYKQVGYLNFHDNLINTATGTVNIRAELSNPRAEILPGQFVRVMVGGLVRVNALTIPQTAVFSTQQGKMAWVVKEGKATPRQIEVGTADDGKFVVTKGLAPGDVLILDNLLKLQPGMLVAPKEIPPVKPASAQARA